MTWRDFIVTSSSLPPVPPSADRAGGVQRNVSSSVALHWPAALPLLPGWLVVYRDREYRLRGGCNERGEGTVLTCQWDSHMWTVILTNGHRLPLSSIRSVARTDNKGQLVAAWTVREHGFDGAGA